MKIKNGLYQIQGNDELINEANKILLEPLPTSYSDKYDAFYETATILNRIIEDRSNKIDNDLKDFIGDRSLENLVGFNCNFILDKETEETIDKLFEREEKIHKIKPTVNYTFTKVL